MGENNDTAELEKKYTTSVAHNHLQGLDIAELDRTLADKAITELKCDTNETGAMTLGVHGVPFSSVRSTKISINPKNNYDNNSQALPDMSQGLLKNQSALINDELIKSSIVKRQKTKVLSNQKTNSLNGNDMYMNKRESNQEQKRFSEADQFKTKWSNPAAIRRGMGGPSHSQGQNDSKQFENLGQRSRKLRFDASSEAADCEMHENIAARGLRHALNR